MLSDEERATLERSAQRSVLLICDNYGTHKGPVIKTWLRRHPWLHMHFIPTCSSRINQVER
ncbi:transposase [Streptosporangium fragile]